MKKYDYLVVGAGLFGSTFAYEMSKRGKKVLVMKILMVLMFINMGLIFFIHLIKKYGIMLMNFVNLIIILIRQLLIIKENFIICHLI